MLFGLPWYAIIAIVSIVGGMYFSFREKEMKHEEKMRTNAKESQELRKMIFNLKQRVENLEKIVAETEDEPELSIDEIEIRNDFEENDSRNKSSKVRG